MIKSKIIKRFFSIKENQQLTRSQIQNVLKSPSFIHIKTTETSILEKKKTFKKKNPKIIFDLNKTKLDDILDHYYETENLELTNIKFGTQIKKFKYGLPIPNIDPKIKGLSELEEELNPTPLTAVQNLYSELNLNSNSSFSDYENSLQKKYNFSELFSKEEKIDNLTAQKKKEILEFIIPYGKIANEDIMNQIRKCVSFNINIPGVVELEDPNRFIENLRPIEEFRNLPVIPISDAEMKRFEEQKKKRKLNMMGFVYSYEKFATVCIFCTSLLLGGYLIKLFLKKDEEMMIEFYRNKISRISN